METTHIEAIKTHMTANPGVVCPNGDTIAINLGNSNFQAIADYYNSAASPESLIWRPDLNPKELNKYLVMTEFQALTVQKQNGWFAMIGGDEVDATNDLVRDNFATIFGANSTTRANLAAVAQRPATVFESLFTTAKVSSVYGVLVGSSDIENATR